MITVALTWLGVALGTAMLLLMAAGASIDAMANGLSSARLRRWLRM